MNKSQQLLKDAKRLGIGINEAKTPSFIGETADGFLAIKIEGLPKIESLKDVYEHRKAIDDFKEKAKKGHADTKRKAYSTGVKKYIKDVEATQYFCFVPKRSGEKDDSVEVYYTD